MGTPAATATLTRSSICCVLAVRATGPPTSPRGRRCIITFASFVARVSGLISGASCEQLNVAGWARIPDPSAAIMDSQSVKTVEESARIRGYDAHMHVKGCKRHTLVDTLGPPPSACHSRSTSPSAHMHDTQEARRLLAGLKYFVPRLKENLG